MSDSTPTLEPCPFCGGKAAYTRDRAAIGCSNCWAAGPATTPEGLAHDWNTRAALDASGNDELEALRKDRERYQWLANNVLYCDYGDNEQGGTETPDRIGWGVMLSRRNAEPFIFGRSIDAAIDAAIARTQEQSDSPVRTQICDWPEA